MQTGVPLNRTIGLAYGAELRDVITSISQQEWSGLWLHIEADAYRIAGEVGDIFGDFDVRFQCKLRAETVRVMIDDMIARVIRLCTACVACRCRCHC